MTDPATQHAQHVDTAVALAPRFSSAVHYRPGAQAAAGAAARTLGAGVLVTADAAVPARHVRVVLGTTYAPPLPAGPAPAAAAGPTGPPVTAGGVPCVD